MQEISIEPFVLAIVIIGIGTMLRVIKLPAAILLITTALTLASIMPRLGNYAQYASAWLFWTIVVIFGISLLRAILSILFGRSAADTVTGRLIYDIFTPIFRIVGGFLRTIFRIR